MKKRAVSEEAMVVDVETTVPKVIKDKMQEAEEEFVQDLKDDRRLFLWDYQSARDSKDTLS